MLLSLVWELPAPAPHAAEKSNGRDVKLGFRFRGTRYLIRFSLGRQYFTAAVHRRAPFGNAACEPDPPLWITRVCAGFGGRISPYPKNPARRFGPLVRRKPL